MSIFHFHFQFFIFLVRCQIKLFASLLAASLWVSLSWAEPQCERINKTISDLHIHCGYNLTARFNFDKHFDSASRAIVSLRSLLKNCSAFVDLMMCSLFLPRCTEEIKGPYLPCRGVCYDFANDCKDIIMEKGLEWTVAMCDILPEKDNPQATKGYRERCFTPSNYKDSGKSKLKQLKYLKREHQLTHFNKHISRGIRCRSCKRFECLYG